MVRRLGLGKNNHLTYDSLALNPRYIPFCSNDCGTATLTVYVYVCNGIFYHRRQFAWNVKAYFFGKIRKVIQNAVCWFLPGGLCWGLMTRQPLWFILCRLPEKGRKVIEEIVEEIKERDREERNRNESEETEEIKIFPIYPYLLQG